MNLATLTTMPHRLHIAPSRDESNPFDTLLRQMQTRVWVVLVEPNGNIYRRVSKRLDDTPDDREFMAKAIRALRADAAGQDHELQIGIERHVPNWVAL